MSARMEKGKRWFKFVLLMVGITAGIKGLFALGHPNVGNKLAQAFVQFVGGTIIFGAPAFFLGWLAGKEEVQKNNNSPKQTAPPPPASSLESSTEQRAEESAPVPLAPRISTATVNENTTAVLAQPPASATTDAPAEELWAAALAEFDSSSRRPGLWAKVFAEAQGNESIAKATYLRHRASELNEENRVRLARLEQEALEKAREVALAKLSEQRRAYALMPKGECPNCEEIIPMSLEHCPRCDANFGKGSAWNITPLNLEQQTQKLRSAFTSGKNLIPEEIIFLAETAVTDRSLIELRDRRRGETLLHCCARLGLQHQVTVLLEHGADANAPNGDGRRPFEVTEDLVIHEALRAAAHSGGT